jgi:hypothetical protein
MAATLAAANVTSLDQIGVGNIMGDVNVKTDVDVNGDPTGTYSKLDTKTGQWVPADAKDIRTVTTGDGENQQQTIVSTGVTGQGLVNKTNGKAIGDGSGKIGYTASGDGGTEYKLKIDPTTGLPIFYTVGVSSNDLANLMTDLGPIGQIGLAIATGGLSIPVQIIANMAVQVLSGKDMDDVIEYINDNPKPLAVYFFGKQKHSDSYRLRDETSSGAYVTNECVSQAITHYTGFGGVGDSGSGRYGGFEGYKNFCNRKGGMIKAAQP